jgi:hypothetical protein
MFIIKLFLALFFWAGFIGVLIFIPYPESFTQANLFQLACFFIPLFFGLFFSLNLLLKPILFSTTISIGLIILLVLKALNYFNFLSIGLTLTTTLLLLSSFKNTSGLTSIINMPKLRFSRRRKKLL